MKQVISRY